MVGTTQATIQRYEKENRKQRLDLAFAIADVLEVDIYFLFNTKRNNSKEKTVQTKEQRLVDYYRSCTPDRQAQILALAADLAALSKNTAQRDPLPEGAVA